MLMESIFSGYMSRAVSHYMNVSWVEKGFRPQPQSGRRYLLYIHVPFCETLCPYCSFHRIHFEPELAERYFRTLRRELELYHDLGFEFEDVYIGGGTPSILPGSLASLIEFIRGRWSVKGVSVEAHPDHLTSSTIALLKGAGVDRLSVGVQTFDGELLGKLSRDRGVRDGQEVRDRLRNACEAFHTVNVDMMYNFPQQTLAMVLGDVAVLRELEVGQITFYPLMEGSENFKKEFGRIDRRREGQFFKQIASALADDYDTVSGWCFARRQGMPDEYIVVHDEYVGVGSGAFGYVGGTLYANSFDVRAHMHTVNRGALPVVATNVYGRRAQMRYDLLMRLFGGSLDVADFKRKYGRYAVALLPDLIALRMAGAIESSNGLWVPTPRGRYYFVILMREFFSGANRLRRFLAAPSQSTSCTARTPAPAHASSALMARSCEKDAGLLAAGLEG